MGAKPQLCYNRIRAINDCVTMRLQSTIIIHLWNAHQKLFCIDPFRWCFFSAYASLTDLTRGHAPWWKRYNRSDDYISSLKHNHCNWAYLVRASYNVATPGSVAHQSLAIRLRSWDGSSARALRSLSATWRACLKNNINSQFLIFYNLSRAVPIFLNEECWNNNQMYGWIFIQKGNKW